MILNERNIKILKEKEKSLKLEILEVFLQYKPLSGNFHWIHSPNTKIRIGSIAGCVKGDGFLHIGFNGKHYYAHRLAWFYMTGNWPIDCITFKDKNVLNIKWNNLYEITYTELRYRYG